MELFHVLNRGTERRPIFMDDRDRARFIHDMYEFNDVRPANNTSYSFRNMDVRHPYIEKRRIVDIHAWCLMRNHYHLLISEREEGGVTSFMRKLNTGYTNYFNERYKRSGVLFQGKTKKKLIDNDAYFLHIVHYIHLNPLDLSTKTRDWRMFKIKNASQALESLDAYKWSSYRDYCGTKNFPSILTNNLFTEVFGNYQKTISSYLKDLDTESISNIALE